MWNLNLTTYDGVPLKLASTTPKVRSLNTEPLSLSLSDVTSAQATNLTGGLWDASTGADWDRLPEVPPDGEETIAECIVKLCVVWHQVVS